MFDKAEECNNQYKSSAFDFHLSIQIFIASKLKHFDIVN